MSEPVNDTYLGMIYVCNLCGWRLSECACSAETMGWSNRHAVGVDAVLYSLGPISVPSAFVKIEAEGMEP